MIKNKERIQSILEILFLLVLGLTPLLWFHDKQVVVGLDSGYGVDYILYFIQRFYTWLGSQNLGVDMSVEVAVFTAPAPQSLDIPCKAPLMPTCMRSRSWVIVALSYMFNLHLFLLAPETAYSSCTADYCMQICPQFLQ